MLDNLTGSSLNESEVVQKMQAARSGEGQESEPNEAPTDETVESNDSEPELLEEVESEGSEIESEDNSEEEEEPELYAVKVDGEERQVSFDDLLSNYSKGEDYTKKTTAVAEDRKAFDAEKAQATQLLETEKAKVSAMTQRLEKVINEQEQKIDWDELRDTDPSEYLRQKEIQEMRVKELNAVQSQATEEAEKRRSETLQTESQKLLSVMGDEWKDPDARQKDLEGMYGYVYSRGISQDEASSVLDHRFWLIVRDAMKYQDLQKTGSAVKKQVKAAPKTVKSGKPVQRKQQAEQEAREKLRKSGGKDANSVVAMLKAKRNR